MNKFKLLTVLLAYPSAELQQAVAEDFVPLLKDLPEWESNLSPLMQYLSNTDLIDIQEYYVHTFDRTPTHSLHLFEHLHGENRDRGDAMLNLLHEYQKSGFEPTGFELPDYLPLFLEFLSMQSEQHAAELLGEAVHVIGYISQKLAANQSNYAPVFELIVSLSPIAPKELSVSPVKDMDEALELFGPNAQGVEPLLTPKHQDVQIVNIAPRRMMSNSSGVKS